MNQIDYTVKQNYKQQEYHIPAYYRKALFLEQQFMGILEKLTTIRTKWNKASLKNISIVGLSKNVFSNRTPENIMNGKDDANDLNIKVNYEITESVQQQTNHSSNKLTEQNSFVQIAIAQTEQLNRNVDNTLKMLFNKFDGTQYASLRSILNLVYESNRLIKFEDVEASSFEYIEQVGQDKDNIVIPVYVDEKEQLGKYFYFDEGEQEPQSSLAGFIGYLYVKKEDIRKEYNVKRITKDLVIQIKEDMKKILNQMCIKANVQTK